MELSESWPSQTCVANQTFAGARLKYNQNQFNHSEPRLDFEFARQKSELFTRPQVPLLQTFPPPVNKTDVPENTDSYRLLVSANGYLRECYPEVDLPKEVLLSHIMEDQDQAISDEISSASKLIGFSIGDQTSVFISTGGPSSNELYCSVMRYPFENDSSSIPVPTFIATAKPIITFPTPILQLANGPCLSFNGQASLLARTIQSTYFFGSPQLNNVSVDGEETDFQSPPTNIDEPIPLITIPTSDTQKVTHLDACIGTARDGFTYGYIVDNRGGIWKTSDPDNGPQCLHIGTLTLTDNDGERIDWARSSATFYQDCITVGLRKSVQVIDPRAGLEPTTVLFDSRNDYKNLYSLNDNHILTDIERHPSHLSPHLRLINTTQSLIVLDDRKPTVPMVSFPHHRTQDLTLRMSFPSDLERFPTQEGFNSTTPNPFVILWSRQNDVASLHSLDRNQFDKPPAMIGYPTTVPVLSTTENNPRTGLVLTSFPNNKSTSKHLSVVEMTRDGALWQQVISLEDQADLSESVTTSFTPSQRRVWDEELFQREKECKMSDQLSRQAITPATKSSMLAGLSIICQDFDKIYISKTAQDESQSLSSDEESRPARFLTRRLDVPDVTDPPIDPELLRSESRISQVDSTDEGLSQNSQSLENNNVIDLMPTLRSILYNPNDKLLNPVENNHDEIERLISNGINNSSRSKYKKSITQPVTQNSLRRETEESEENNGVDAVERLMSGWKIGIPSSEYEWKDICIEDQEVEEEDELDTDYGRSSRRQTPLSGLQRSRDYSIGFDYDTQFSEVRSKIEIGRAPSRSVSRKEPSTPGRSSKNRSMDFTSPFTTPFKESTHQHHHDRSSPSHLPSNEPNNFYQSQNLPTTNSNGFGGSLSQETFGGNLMAFSQVLPGPHGDRSNPGGHVKKKKRVGGF
ncbi:uncharacterized protein MELLADRAFT_116210 [Melampsora larici-populina 98AG31]|uniref:Uncharacterized protein n=1 Tax=Melampsora larici-populina (strain 98AG31 / pathotype 3-4-7) TaxID=747676 RepID=F4RIW8_MELLP|nr:uncharacterized protein MELLADRAFT_116210 [Melampsora larici-populina 98AG31]EGG07635.1 hypothetical protein MELLADRAFT_116210 [Melampsora larici-populina 98AG31]